MYAHELEELELAAEALDRVIKRHKKNFEVERGSGAWSDATSADDYYMNHRDGQLILAPLLANQVTILNQIEKLKNREVNKRMFENAMEAWKGSAIVVPTLGEEVRQASSTAGFFDDPRNGLPTKSESWIGNFLRSRVGRKSGESRSGS